MYFFAPRFYSTDGNPDSGCDYRALVQDVCGYDLGPFVHKAEQVISKHTGVHAW